MSTTIWTLFFFYSFNPVTRCIYKGRWQIRVCAVCPHRTGIDKILSFVTVKDGIYAFNGYSQIAI